MKKKSLRASSTLVWLTSKHIFVDHIFVDLFFVEQNVGRRRRRRHVDQQRVVEHLRSKLVKVSPLSLQRHLGKKIICFRN